ncbi:MAG: hypothetical protein IKU60_02460 [Clostridia bacterium]|nr:hypothetical protein [Clostridia bacterium]
MRVIQMNPSSRPKEINFTVPPSPAPSFGEKKAPFDIKSFKKDDWILIGIILVLILEGSDDYILLCALGYLFIMGL